MDEGVIQWLRRRFVTGFFVMVPLVVSLLALVWIFRVIDGLTAPLYRNVFAPKVPPPGLGILTTAAAILVVGVIATNMFGKRLLQRLEGYLLRVPVFRTIYAPIKQLALAFSPDNEYGFKRVVMVRSSPHSLKLGFLTKEFSVETAGKVESLVAVFVPTNHLYLGDIVICPSEDAVFPDISVEEGIRVFLTGGMALPLRLKQALSDKVAGRS